MGSGWKLGAAAATLCAGGSAVFAEEVVQFAQLQFQQRVIIRVRTEQLPPAKPIKWREKDGPKCIDVNALAGAQVTEAGVDILLRGGQRVRARLANECPALNYYSGFYVRPGADGRICQDRDSIRTRAGGACEIDKFRMLLPPKAKK
jgi:hypothetical protein